MIDLVLVDFDDTIVDTAPRFQNARRELFRLLTSAGFAETDAHRVHHDEVDPLMRHQYGLGPARMEHSFRATYEALCRAAGFPVDDDVAERAAAFGRVVAGVPPVFDGAIAALARLAAVLPTALYTVSGDPDYQISCIEAAGVLGILPRNRVRICAHKTAAQFRQVLDEFGVADPATSWMIGNSMRSDINPALQIGANAVLVDVADPWEFDHAEPVSDAFHRATTFSEAVDLVLRSGVTCE